MFDHYHHAGVVDETWTAAGQRDHEDIPISSDGLRVHGGVHEVSQLQGYGDASGYYAYDNINDGHAATSWAPGNARWQDISDLYSWFPDETHQPVDWDAISEAPQPRASEQEIAGTAVKTPADGLTVEAATLCRCDECGKKFKRPEHLRRHIGSVHGKGQTLVCKVKGCGKSFNRRDNWRDHLKRHVKDGPRTGYDAWASQELENELRRINVGKKVAKSSG